MIFGNEIPSVVLQGKDLSLRICFFKELGIEGMELEKKCEKGEKEREKAKYSIHGNEC